MKIVISIMCLVACLSIMLIGCIDSNRSVDQGIKYSAHTGQIVWSDFAPAAKDSVGSLVVDSMSTYASAVYAGVSETSVVALSLDTVTVRTWNYAGAMNGIAYGTDVSEFALRDTTGGSRYVNLTLDQVIIANPPGHESIIYPGSASFTDSIGVGYNYVDSAIWDSVFVQRRAVVAETAIVAHGIYMVDTKGDTLNGVNVQGWYWASGGYVLQLSPGRIIINEIQVDSSIAVGGNAVNSTQWAELVNLVGTDSPKLSFILNLATQIDSVGVCTSGTVDSLRIRDKYGKHGWFVFE